MQIKRIWHGWTTPENAEVYEALLHSEVFLLICIQKCTTNPPYLHPKLPHV